MKEERPLARCPANEVEAYSFPFFIVRSKGVEPDFILLPVHLWEMTEEEKTSLGEMVEVEDASRLESLGYPRDDEGVFVVGE